MAAPAAWELARDAWSVKGRRKVCLPLGAYRPSTSLHSQAIRGEVHSLQTAVAQRASKPQAWHRTLGQLDEPTRQGFPASPQEAGQASRKGVGPPLWPSGGHQGPSTWEEASGRAEWVGGPRTPEPGQLATLGSLGLRSNRSSKAQRCTSGLRMGLEAHCET